MQIRAFALPDQEAVVTLWDRCGLIRPWNDPRNDIQRKLKVQPELFLVAEGQIIGTVMAGYDGHRAWLYYLAVDPSRRREGIGAAVVAEAERLVSAMGCPKLNLQVRGDNHSVGAFYTALGFQLDNTVGFGKRLEHDI